MNSVLCLDKEMRKLHFREVMIDIHVAGQIPIPVFAWSHLSEVFCVLMKGG
jgi:hypothetical protein